MRAKSQERGLKRQKERDLKIKRERSQETEILRKRKFLGETYLERERAMGRERMRSR